MHKNDTTTPLQILIARVRDRDGSVAPEVLADALEIIDVRLRLLEPCSSRGGTEPHTWAPIGKRFADVGDPLRCIYCGMVKP